MFGNDEVWNSITGFSKILNSKTPSSGVSEVYKKAAKRERRDADVRLSAC